MYQSTMINSNIRTLNSSKNIILSERLFVISTQGDFLFQKTVASLLEEKLATKIFNVITEHIFVTFGGCFLNLTFN